MRNHIVVNLCHQIIRWKFVESSCSQGVYIFLDEITEFVMLPNSINLNTMYIQQYMYVNIYVIFLLLLPLNAHSFLYFGYRTDIIYRLVSQLSERLKLWVQFFFLLSLLLNANFIVSQIFLHFSQYQDLLFISIKQTQWNFPCTPFCMCLCARGEIAWPLQRLKLIVLSVKALAKIQLTI